MSMGLSCTPVSRNPLKKVQGALSTQQQGDYKQISCCIPALPRLWEEVQMSQLKNKALCNQLLL